MELDGLRSFVFDGAAEVEDISQQMKSNLAQGWLDEMRMLNIEVLKDFQRERAVFLRSW